MFKQYFEIGDKVECVVPGEFPVTGIVTDVDRYFDDYDMVTIDCETVSVDDISLVVSDYYCIKIEE